MRRKRRLVIIHVDGLSFKRLHEAIRKGSMPTLHRLLIEDGYQAIPYRTGIPSTTPFAQAGILFGNNTNIPSFTWFDKVAGVVVKFGGLATFQKVAHKYFTSNEPLTQGGATIAACYPAGAVETFATAYRDPKSPTVTRNHERRNVLLQWFLNPFHIIDWVSYTFIVLFAYFIKFIRVHLWRESVAYKYFFTNLMQEIFLHHLTRYAVVQAMRDGYPVIYAAFYNYDDGAHAFGPNDPFCQRMLYQLDKSIQYIDKNRRKNAVPYELIILSDHGSIPMLPFSETQHQHFAEIIAKWLPHFLITESPGITIQPKTDRQDGEIHITYSGGLGHLYFRSLPGRADYKTIEQAFPGIMKKIVRLKEVSCLLVKDENSGLLIMKSDQISLADITNPKLQAFLKQFDSPSILLSQLRRFNTFSHAGDIIFFGAFIDGKQVNFENQMGGHGAFGDDQMHPFILIKPEWQLPTKNLIGAHKIHDMLKNFLQVSYQITK